MSVPLLPALLAGSYLVILYLVAVLLVRTPNAVLLWLGILLCLGNLFALLRPLPRGLRLSLVGLNALAAAVMFIVIARTLLSGSVEPDLAKFMPVLLYLLVFVPLIAALYLWQAAHERSGGSPGAGA